MQLYGSECKVQMYITTQSIGKDILIVVQISDILINLRFPIYETLNKNSKDESRYQNNISLHDCSFWPQ